MSDIDLKWYILRVKSGCESKVLKIFNSYYRDGNVEEVFVPSLSCTNANGDGYQKRVLPGYIFIKMRIDDLLLKRISNIHFAYSFFMQGDRPKCISDDEVNQVKLSVENFNSSVAVDKVLAMGSEVLITEGPFESYRGKVEGLNDTKGKVKVRLLFFGRKMIVSFKISQLRVVNES